MTSSPTAPVRVAVFATVASVEVGLAWAAASGTSVGKGRWSLPVLVGGWAGAWMLAILVALRLPRRQAIGLIVAAGIALRLAALAGPPRTSDDLYRYSWDGRVQAAGTDPYATAPSAGALVRLREPWLWPNDAGCSSIGKPGGCTRINRPDARTIYPPVAEAWFAGVYRLVGNGARHKTWQVAGLVTESATLVLLAVALRRWNRDPRWLALYALCPAPVLEIVNNGHVDGLAIALIVGAIIVAVPTARSSGSSEPMGGRPDLPRSPASSAGSTRSAGGRPGLPWAPAYPAGATWSAGGRPGLPRSPAYPAGATRNRTDHLAGAATWRLVVSAALITAAALVKLYPAVLLLPLVACWPGRRPANAWRAGLTASVLGAVAYAPHVVRVGSKVLGYLPGYLKEEHYQGGGRYLIANVLQVPPALAGLVSLIGVGLVAGWVVVRRPPIPTASAALFTAILLASSPAQPWYAVTLLALATLATRPALVAVVGAGYVASFAVILDRPASANAGGCAYSAALAVVVLAALRRRGILRLAKSAPAAPSLHGTPEINRQDLGPTEPRKQPAAPTAPSLRGSPDLTGRAADAPMREVCQRTAQVGRDSGSRAEGVEVMNGDSR